MNMTAMHETTPPLNEFSNELSHPTKKILYL